MINVYSPTSYSVTIPRYVSYQFATYFKPLIIEYPPTEGPVEVIDFPPRSGPKNSQGNRPCDHLQLDGDVWYFSSRVSTQEVVPGLFSNHIVDPITRLPIRPFDKLGVLKAGSSNLTYAGAVIVWGQTFVWNFPDMTNIYDEINGTYKDHNVTVLWFPTYVLFRRSWIDFYGVARTSDYTLAITSNVYPRSLYRSSRYNGVNNPITTVDLDKETLLMRASVAFCDLPPEDKNLWGDLTQTAIQDATVLDINTALYFRDFVLAKDSLLGIVKALKGAINPKTIADLYLSYKYGMRLTALDTVRAYKEIESKYIASGDFTRSVRSMEFSKGVSMGPTWGSLVWERSSNLKIYYNPVEDGWRHAVYNLFQWDLFPTLENVWDFVPFTFVVDWFIKIGDGLAEVDAKTFASVLRVLSTLSTTRISMSGLSAVDLFRLPDHTCLGNISCTHFVRTPGYSLSLPVPSFERAHEFHNYAELAAILVQQAGRR